MNVTSPMMAARPLLIVLAFGLLILLAWYAVDVVLLSFAGILGAIFLHAPADWLSRSTSLGYRWCLALLIVVLLTATAIGTWSLANNVRQQVRELQETLPRAIDRLRQTLERSELGSATLEKAEEGSDGTNFGQNVASSATTVISTTLGGVASFIFVLFLGIFLAIEPSLYQQGVLLLVPSRHIQRATELLNELGTTLRWWLVGTLFSMSVIGVFSGIGLWMLGIPNAVLIAIFTALLTFIPNIGPLISIVPPALLASLQGPWQVFYVVLLYAGIQAVETYCLAPLVHRKTVHLPPALLISTQVLMGVLTGLLGVMLATPLTACGLVLVKRLYVQDTLGKSVD